jgi:hypothetical protein
MHTTTFLWGPLWLLTLCAPIAEGIALTSQHDLQPQFLGGNDLQPEITGASDLQPQVLGRSALRSKILSGSALQYFLELANASSSKPVLVPPHHSLLSLDSGQETHVINDFQPSADFTRAGEENMRASEEEEEESVQKQKQGHGAELPWGIGSPRWGDNMPVHQYSAVPILDVPKDVEYSLEAGGNMQSFSSARQDVKIITQVLENVTNGFYLDSNGGDGEASSNTLLLELTGWRGLILEPMIYDFANLWGKMRKAWLFLGTMSPHENGTKIGFDSDGMIDMLSGHQIHAYSLSTFLEEMGGRVSVDFWDLHCGGYEAEVLNETLLHSGTGIEIGVVLVSLTGRGAGRGSQSYVQPRSQEDTTNIIFEIFGNASFQYIGGMDAVWLDGSSNRRTPTYEYRQGVWVNPVYFQSRDIPVPSSVKAAPPPRLEHPVADQNWRASNTWDEGFTLDQEIDIMRAYILKSKQQAAPMEQTAQAHRVDPTPGDWGVRPGRKHSASTLAGFQAME